jgi:hypothetical protein
VDDGVAGGGGESIGTGETVVAGEFEELGLGLVATLGDFVTPATGGRLVPQAVIAAATSKITATQLLTDMA